MIPLPPEWASYAQFIQELAAGTIRRNRFTLWEVDLLLDMEVSRIRKSSRPDILRRYLKAVLQRQAAGADAPPRLAAFLRDEAPPRGSAAAGGA